MAGFSRMVGLLDPDQRHITGFALTEYKRAGEEKDFSLAWQVGRSLASRRATIRSRGVRIRCVGDRAARRSAAPSLMTLPFTATNPGVRVFRHAMAIQAAAPQDQDIRLVWFAGVHSDIGGGYPEADAATGSIEP